MELHINMELHIGPLLNLYKLFTIFFIQKQNPTGKNFRWVREIILHHPLLDRMFAVESQPHTRLG